jgi:hypothetical protein
MTVRQAKSGLTLVKKDKTLTAATGKAPNTRIERSGYIADIVLSESPISPSGYIFHYIIQRVGSAVVVSWGQETSMEDAKQSVNDFIDHRVSNSA